MALINMAVPDEEPRPAFFSVGIVKLVVMSTATFGIYEIFWFYEHWSALKARDQTMPGGAYRDIRPFWRAFFALFFMHTLVGELNDTARRWGVTRSVSAGGATTAFIVLSLCARLPDPFWLLSLFTVVPLVYAQDVANDLMARTRPEADPNTRFVGWNWAALLLGLPAILLTIAATFMGE